MTKSLAWNVVRFTTLTGGAAYVDLSQIAAILEKKEPDPSGKIEVDAHGEGFLSVLTGATIYLYGGRAFYVRETADVVFGELHRFCTAQPEQPESMKVGGGAPVSPAGAPEFYATTEEQRRKARQIPD